MLEDIIKFSFIFLLEKNLLYRFLILFEMFTCASIQLYQRWILSIIVPVMAQYGPCI